LLKFKVNVPFAEPDIVEVICEFPDIGIFEAEADTVKVITDVDDIAALAVAVKGNKTIENRVITRISFIGLIRVQFLVN